MGVVWTALMASRFHFSNHLTTQAKSVLKPAFSAAAAVGAQTSFSLEVVAGAVGCLMFCAVGEGAAGDAPRQADAFLADAFSTFSLSSLEHIRPTPPMKGHQPENLYSQFQYASFFPSQLESRSKNI